ncbi:hypothetical protein OIU78_012425, partial [Salix suchowensis]
MFSGRRSSCPSCKLRGFRCSIFIISLALLRVLACHPWDLSAHSFSSSGNSNESGLLFNGIARLFCNLCC